MTLRPAFIPPLPELDSFLFASIGEEVNGLQLSVLSALSRLDLDPRDEAARLSRLTKNLATDQLARMIEAVAGTRWTLVEAHAIADELVKHLPEAKTISSDSRSKRDVDFKPFNLIRPSNNLIYAVLAVAVLLSLAFASISFVNRHELPSSPGIGNNRSLN